MGSTGNTEIDDRWSAGTSTPLAAFFLFVIVFPCCFSFFLSFFFFFFLALVCIPSCDIDDSPRMVNCAKLECCYDLDELLVKFVSYISLMRGEERKREVRKRTVWMKTPAHSASLDF